VLLITCGFGVWTDTGFSFEKSVNVVFSELGKPVASVIFSIELYGIVGQPAYNDNTGDREHLIGFLVAGGR